MNNESPEDRNVMELWQNQKTEGVRMSVEQIRLEAGKFERRIWARNLREYVAAIAVIVFFAWDFAKVHQTLPRIAYGLMIAGMVYLVWHLLSKGSPATADESAALSSWIEFRRRELVRQRDLLRSVWLWYLGPLIPGLVLVFIAAVRAAHGSRHSSSHAALIWTVDALVVVGIFLGIGWLNKRAARKLQGKIDELDEQERD